MTEGCFASVVAFAPEALGALRFLLARLRHSVTICIAWHLYRVAR